MQCRWPPGPISEARWFTVYDQKLCNARAWNYTRIERPGVRQDRKFSLDALVNLTGREGIAAFISASVLPTFETATEERYSAVSPWKTATAAVVPITCRITKSGTSISTSRIETAIWV
jgi:hypothetical protein